ncbi:MAG: hypothetical protein LBH16_06795 [Treponema sp.]|jgi:hypothetical protein|nr:hypothetical protein [Treponema sp.]
MKIPVYSKLKDDELQEMHKHFSEKYNLPVKRALMNKDKFLSKDVVYEMTKENINEFNLEWLKRNLTELALIMYNFTKSTNNFEPYDELTLSICLARSILNIPNDRGVTLFDITRLERKLDECHKKFGGMSSEQYMAYLQNYNLNILGMKYPQTDFTYINDLLELLNADFYFYNSYSYPCGSRFILCKLEKIKIEQNEEVYLIQKEFVRTHHFISGIVAEVYKNSSIIRIESYKTIFQNKWQNFYENQDNNDLSLFPNTALCEGIKRKTLHLHNAFTTNQVKGIKGEFIQDMMQNSTIAHERGHQISYRKIQPIHHALHFNFIEGGGVLHVIHEALADWAVDQEDGSKGFFAWVLDISRTDKKRATRHVYNYMSDNFFDSDDENPYMVLMSNVLVGLAISFIKDDGTIKFNQLAEEKDQIYSFFQATYKNIMDMILEVIQNAEYDTGIITLDYYGIENELYEMYQQSRNARSVEELHLLSFFWTNVINYLQKYSKDGWAEYQNVLNQGADSLELSIINYITKGNEERYQYSIRNFIIEKSVDIGIIDTTILSRIPAKEENYDYMQRSGFIKRATVFKSSKKHLPKNAN